MLQVNPFETPSFTITGIVKQHITHDCAIMAAHFTLWQGRSLVTSSPVFLTSWSSASFLCTFLDLDLTWWVSQWCMEHRKVDQGIGCQEKVGDDGGNYVQLSCKKKRKKKDHSEWAKSQSWIFLSTSPFSTNSRLISKSIKVRHTVKREFFLLTSRIHYSNVSQSICWTITNTWIHSNHPNNRYRIW